MDQEITKDDLMENVEIPVAWVKQLLNRGKRVEKQLQELNAKDHMVIMKTDISALVGFASSCETILKFNPRR